MQKSCEPVVIRRKSGAGIPKFINKTVSSALQTHNNFLLTVPLSNLCNLPCRFSIMRYYFFLFLFICLPVFLFSQSGSDSSMLINKQAPLSSSYVHQRDSTFSLLFNASTIFYTAKDSRINNFLDKYGYTSPQTVPMGIRLELAVIPFESKMMYSINAATVVSRQSIVTADFSLGAYRRFVEKKNFWIVAGLALGVHYDRIVLNGNLPPSFDSIANIYGNRLSLHRAGFVAEPSTKIYWYPFQWQKFQIGMFAGVGYDFDFNSQWKLGYYNKNGTYTTFHRIRQSSNVKTHHEYGWVFTAGLSACIKFK